MRVGLDGAVDGDAERRLHAGEGRDDLAPDMLDGGERQRARVARDQAAHHVGLALRPEGGAGPAGALGPDQASITDAALDQQPVHLRVDRVDLLAKLGERPRVAFAGLGHGMSGCRWHPGRSRRPDGRHS